MFPVEASWSPKIKQTNVCYTRKTVAIADIRGHERKFLLDKHGFQLGNCVTSLSYNDFASTETIVARYYEEVKQFLKENIEAIGVLPFDFQVRQTLSSASTCNGSTDLIRSVAKIPLFRLDLGEP